MAALNIVEQCLEALDRKGFDKAQVRLVANERHELQAEFDKPSLLRTVHNNSLVLAGIVDGKRGSVALNKQDDVSVAQAIDEPGFFSPIQVQQIRAQFAVVDDGGVFRRITVVGDEVTTSEIQWS